MKMLIVDDEPVICRGLSETISWETIGVEVVGEASDGEEALELISRQPVDLVLTDINMDGMDGLSLSRTLREQYPHIRIIILSGYNDFEYARQALRIGLEDYLLKPVDVDELVGMVKRIGGEMALEADRMKQRKREEWLNWLNRLMQSGGTLSKEDRMPSVPEKVCGFRMMASQLKDYALWAEHSTEEERQTARRKWEQAVQNAFPDDEQEVISVFHHPNLLISLCIGSMDTGKNSLHAALAEVTGPAGTEHRLHFGLSPVFRSLTEAYTRCSDAIAAVQNTDVLMGKTVVFYEDTVPQRKYRGPAASQDLEKQLVNLLFDGSTDELENVLGDMMRESSVKGSSLADIGQAYKEFKIVIQRRLRSSTVDVSAEIERMLNGDIDICTHNSYRAVEALIRCELMSLFSFIHSSVKDKNHWAVDRIKKYIESHYSTDLKASEVANWLQITPNYFSIVFNQYFGKGFAEYLNEVRIEHAKDFLSGTHDRVFEIADKVGYKDYKYFCSIFKSHTGVTPTQYRKFAETTTA